MSEPFLAEIKIVGFNFPPRGFAGCDGQILPINQNQSLFSLLGTTYGGDGRTSFALPDLRGRVPLHSGDSSPLGQRAGEESHRLLPSEMPNHDHSIMGTSNMASTSTADSSQTFATTMAGRRGFLPYAEVDDASKVALRQDAVSPSGANLPHNKMQPSMVVNFVIALQGLFPSRN